MKVAQVSQHYLPMIGGQEVYIDNLVGVFREAGIESQVFQPDRGVRRADIITVPRVPGLGRIIDGSEPYVFNLLLGLTQLNRLAEADVVIAHYAFSAWALGRLAKKTIILSHGVDWHTEGMTWDDKVHEHVARARLQGWPHVVNDTHYLRHFGFDVPPATGFFTEVVPNKWFIPNCVDTRYFAPNKGLPELRSRAILLVPRQVTPDRGIHLAIEAFRPVWEMNPELTLLVLGKIRLGPYYRSCVELARRLGIEKQVVFQDNVENSRMPDYFSSSLLTIIPTLRREGTSLSALESMACGTATVSTNVAGLADLPTVQCDPTPTALATAINATLGDRERIGAQQRTTVSQQFNIEKWAEAWLRVVRTIAER